LGTALVTTSQTGDAAALLEAIREEARPGLWALGVNLARANAVSIESRSAEEVVLRVRVAGRPVALQAILYPKDSSWECNCPSKVDPCEHVVAAAILLQKAPDAPVATKPRGARVAYRFGTTSGGLLLKRVLVQPDGTESALESSLLSLLAIPAKAAQLQVEECDLQADRLLEKPTRTALPPERLAALLQILEPSRTVLLDGRPVAVSAERVLPRARVEDHGEKVVLTLERDPRITQVVAAGVALVQDALCRLGETAMTGPWLAGLPVVRTFGTDELGALTAKVLPDLWRKLPVEVRSQRIPRVDRELKPRLHVELKQLDTGLSALPTLVYGSPPSVRIDDGRMTYLQGAVPVRDEAAEQRLIHSLREELNLMPGRRVTVHGADMARLVDRLRRWRGELGGDARAVVSPQASLRPVLEVQASSAGGPPQVRFGLTFQLQGAEGQSSVGAAEVLRAWQEGLGIVPLLQGGWAPLPLDWLQKHGREVADLLAARAEDGRVANHALAELGELCDALEYPRPPDLKRLASLAEGFERLGEPTLPADLTAELRPYQRQGVAWLEFLRQSGVGGILADDMGLGKTLQAICSLSGRALVVCPTSVLPNWVAELRRFRPALRIGVYHGPGRSLDEPAEVTLTTYAILRMDSVPLSAVDWSSVVLDEAQAIKNPDSQVAKAAFGLKAEVRVALTGTPVENRLEELWSIMNFANPGLLGGRRDFDRKWASDVSEGRAEAAQGLRKKLRPFVLRRLKKDVAQDLPPRTESVLRVNLDEKERSIYDAVLGATRSEVVAEMEKGGGVLKALEALLRLRQAACHGALVPGQQAESSSKVEALLEMLETAASDGHKALVFSQWTSLLDLIQPHLTKAGVLFERLDGSTANRGEVVERFQSSGGPPVMLISLKAGGTGLNLTAADHVFLMDPWWNPAVEAQAADRAHRMGQERPVNIYRLVSLGTVEERILQLQDRKRALFDAALEGAGAAAALTREDLLELLA
jgi:superfamily II DNA or RNA helicase